VLCATGDTRIYIGDSRGDPNPETMSEKIFESANRKNGNGDPRRDSGGVLRAKTENSVKSMLLKRDMIQLSDGEDDQDCLEHTLMGNFLFGLFNGFREGWV
jgi:hypothetical protein